MSLPSTEYSTRLAKSDLHPLGIYLVIFVFEYDRCVDSTEAGTVHVLILSDIWGGEEKDRGF